MKFISVREIRNNPGRVWESIEDSEAVLTVNGKPVGLLMGTGDMDLSAVLSLIRRVRAQQAVSRSYGMTRGATPIISNLTFSARLAAMAASRSRQTSESPISRSMQTMGHSQTQLTKKSFISETSSVWR